MNRAMVGATLGGQFSKNRKSGQSMSKQSGRGGMGSHKHGISGKAPRSRRYKFMQTLEANRQPESPKLTATTIAEVFKRK
jgi:hypothetical protein